MTARDVQIGVDGWRRGWVAATADGDSVRWAAHERIGDLLGPLPAGATVAVDMPVGALDGPRRSDAAARAFLAERDAPWQSIFLSPTARVIADYEAGRSHAEAMAAARVRGEAGTSIQAWNLIARIVELRDALTATRAHVVEAHPECSFRTLDATIGAASKKTGLGVGLRLRALRTAFPDIDLAQAPPDVPVDDLLDAAAVAWTARRLARGEAFRLPADPGDDEPRVTV